MFKARWKSITVCLPYLLISLGGITIIFSILAILVFITWEGYPLWKRPKASRVAKIDLTRVVKGMNWDNLPSPPALGIEEYREIAFLASAERDIHFFSPITGKLIKTVKVDGIKAGHITTSWWSLTSKNLILGTSTGDMVPVEIDFSVSFAGGKRTIRPTIKAPKAINIDPEGKPIFLMAFKSDENQGVGSSHWEVHNPYPEITLKTLFGKVWYEGYQKPEFVWQSTGGTDEFEPKLSLTPLVYGTLKGTFYALIFAIPLAVLGAIYASQFMRPNLKRIVKPAIEIMAALPSVVLGFLAGLWMAPLLEKILPAVLIMPLVIISLIVVAVFIWQYLPQDLRQYIKPGTEAFLLIPIICLGIYISILLNHYLETLLFNGDYRAWLYEHLGLRYDQRNSLVVGFAMGFAVIPIIFTISEDALSSIPRHLIAGSYALGATRWQTAIRMVLPAASPGIFSAIMIGFGRAVGETMVVLMATGNTPVMDGSPFTGFRALSANIAVEIAEAPYRGTLYRVLFLAALLLFVLTFIVNTTAEIIRMRLRKRYSQL